MLQTKFAYSSLGKAFKKQVEKQVAAIKSIKISHKKNQLKKIVGIFPQNLMNDLIRDKLKEIVKSQNITKTDHLRYKSKSRKVYNFSEMLFSHHFLRHILERHLSLKGGDNEQSNLLK